MNNVINKFLLAGDKFAPEIHLRQPQFTYSACGPFTKHEQRIQKFKETGDTNYVYKNELDKACFVHDAAYSDSKDLTKRTVADKILKNKAFDIAKDPKYDGYQRGLASMVYKFFDSKVSGSGAKLIPENEQLAEELHKPIIRKFEKRKVYSTFKDNIWGLRKNIFACLFSVHNTISLSRHEQVCLMRLRFERYFSHHRDPMMGEVSLET